MTTKNIEIKEYPLVKSGKVREVFDIGNSFLFVATDRVSAYDSILPTPIPDKGRVLTQLSVFWFDLFKDVAANHLITADFSEFPENLKKYKELDGKSMIVKKAQVFPIECVVRGYLVGSGWAEYQKSNTVCGIKLPEGLKEASELDSPIFTPATKADLGHDENISFEEMTKVLGLKTSEKLRDISLKIYSKARSYAKTKGIILADTKFEFGTINGEITLIDEVLTPDSSRFWPADKYEEGRAQQSYDKQFVRDYLTESGWDKEPPAPELPEEVVQKTREKYLEILEILTK